MNDSEPREYKSPTRKLVKFFHKSRDQWKAKCIDTKATVKRLKNRVRYLEASKEEWKNRALALEKELAGKQAQGQSESQVKKNGELKETVQQTDIFAEVPRCHSFSIGHIWLFVTLVLSAVASLRSSSGILKLVLPFFGHSSRCPSWYAGRLWLLRIGYYKLMRPKEQADDWVWIIDHTVQLGEEKCLLILGVRLSALVSAPDLTLKHEDVEPINLYPVTSSNGAVVFQQLEETIEKTGVPRAIVADHGSDVRTGIERFVQAHPTTSHIYDIKHKTAALLKNQLQHDETWKQFTKLAAQTKSQVQQMAIAFVAPPNQRTKARYMNLEILVRWGQRALVLLDHIERRTDTRESFDKIKEKLGWLTQFREPISEWAELTEVAISVESFVRKQGLWRGCEAELAQCLDPAASSPRASQLREQLLDFVTAQSSQAKPNERLLGSSEIIESVLGKTKRLEQDQSKSGFTALILGAAAIVSQTTREVVTTAMETVPTKKVIAWIHEKLGQSVQSKRTIAFSTARGSEQKRDHLLSSI